MKKKIVNKVVADSNKEKGRLRNLIKIIVNNKPIDLKKVFSVCEIIKENYILELVDFEVDIYNGLCKHIDDFFGEEKDFCILRDDLYNNGPFDDFKIQNILCNILCKHNKRLTTF